MKHIVIILAGGLGSRVGGETPKQLLPLKDGRTVLEHSVDAFEQATCIDEIAIVMHPEWIDEAQTIVERNAWQKVTRIIPGGAERWESSWNAIRAYLQEHVKEDKRFVWFHDAARPFVSQEIIKRVADGLKTYWAVTVAVPMTDTLYCMQGNKVADIPNRKAFMRAQTPQAFHMAVISSAYMRAIESGHVQATDDVGILMKYNPEIEVYVVAGEEANKKITYSEDLDN